MKAWYIKCHSQIMNCVIFFAYTQYSWSGQPIYEILKFKAIELFRQLGQSPSLPYITVEGESQIEDIDFLVLYHDKEKVDICLA